MSNSRFGKTGKKLTSVLIIACFLGFTGCGGSSEVSSPRMGKIMGGKIIEKTDANGHVLKTVPLAEDISGLTYRSGRRVGVTDKDGFFFYKPGETIEFAIDRVLVGKLDISETETGYAYTRKNLNTTEYKYYIPTASTDEDRILLVSMRDVAAGWDAELNDAKVINMIRFLESLDEDKNSSNGIKISSSTATLVQSTCDYLGITEIDFSSSTQSETIISGMNSVAGSGSYILNPDNAKMKDCLFSTYSKYRAMPLALFSLGDGFMSGAQSGIVNIHEATQNRGVARITSDLLNEAGDNGVWVAPLLSMNADRSVVRKTEYDTNGNVVLYIPSNVSVPTATSEDILAKYTGSGDSLLDELLKPVTWVDCLNAPATQLDAVLYSASQDTAKGRLKIFTIWTGMQDVYKNIVPGTSTSLDNVTAGLSDIETVKSSINQTVTRIKTQYPDAKIFIATIPDIDTMAVSLSREDLATFVSNSNLNAIESPTIIGLDPGSRVGLNAFINKIAPTLNPGMTMVNVNTAIAGLSSSEILSPSEQAELKTRSDALNSYISSLSDSKTVYKVDINGLFKDYKNNKFAYIDEKYFVRVPSEGFEDTTSSIRYITPVWGGGLFSSDGYYPSHTGNALIANSFFTQMTKADLGFDPENIQKPTALTLNHEEEYWYINVEAAWDIDPYRDFDMDGFPGGPGLMPPTDDLTNYIPVASPEFSTVEDCDDATTASGKVNKLPKAVTGVDCQ